MEDPFRILTPELETFINGSFSSPALKIFPLTGDGSLRRYFRINKDNESTCLLLQYPTDTDPKELEKFESIQKCLFENKIAVPEILSIDKNLNSILLEDLGDLTLERYFWQNPSADYSLPYYKQALEVLFKFYYNVTQATNTSEAHSLHFTPDKFSWEINYAYTNLNKIKNFSSQSPDLHKKALIEWTRICENMGKDHQTICHRDYHSRNLMIQNDQLYTIDFQDARYGPLNYDLASLLYDPYTGLTKEIQDSLSSDFYLEVKKNPLFKLSFEEFKINLVQNAVQRLFKACGSFSAFYNQREDTRYLKYIAPTMKQIKNLLEEHTPESHFLKEIQQTETLFQTWEAEK